MKAIMLVCSAGMSTSLLVTKMRKSAESRNLGVEIFAVSASEFDSTMEQKNVDVILLGPQIRFMKDQIINKVKDKNIPVETIDMRYYGMVDGEKVLDQALALMD